MADGSFEHRHFSRGMRCIAGIDEAGRGPLAGPVVAAAVVLPRDWPGHGLDDSKKLTRPKREALHDLLTGDRQVCWAIGIADVSEIDSLNILRATHLAMSRAVQALAAAPDWCLIDGLPVKDFPLPYEAIVGGDSASWSIAAASIIAKVHRDQIMAGLDAHHPQYGFARNCGYGTAFHLTALGTHGPCPHHRMSFAPVARAAGINPAAAKRPSVRTQKPEPLLPVPLGDSGDFFR